MPRARQWRLGPFDPLLCGAGTVAAFLAAPAGAQAAGGAASDEPLVTTIAPISANMANCGPAVRYRGEAGHPRCAFDDVALGFTIDSRAISDSADVELYGSFAGGARGALSAQRLFSSWQPGLDEEYTVAFVGMKGALLDGRVNFTTELSRSENWLSPLHDAPRLLDRPDGRSGWARKQRLEVKIVDSPQLRWSVTGESSKVSGGYYIGSGAAIRRQVGPPGQRHVLASALTLGRTRFTASYDDHRTGFGSSEIVKFGLSRGGISFKLSSRASSVEPGPLTGRSESRTTRQSAYLDLDLTSLAPAAGRGALGLLLPQTVSLNWTRGRTDSGAGFARSYRLGGWEFLGRWDTRIGETMIGFRRDEKAAVTPGLRDSVSQYVQASHTVRRDGWRLGIDTVAAADSVPGARGFGNRSLTVGSTLAYSRPGGPEFRLRIGRDRSRMAMSDGSYLSSSNATSITAALDLSRYLQRRFDRPDLNLRVEFRKRARRTSHELELFDQALERWLERDSREGLLLTFGMKL